MGKRGVKEEIINFNPRTIGTENREAVEKLLKKNSESFDPEVSIKINFFMEYTNKMLMKK